MNVVNGIKLIGYAWDIGLLNPKRETRNNDQNVNAQNMDTVFKMVSFVCFWHLIILKFEFVSDFEF